jgi:DNA (cytosine-5)-methyltransferase 1
VADPISASEGKTYTHEGTTFRTHNVVQGPPAVAFSIMPMNSGKDYKARAVEVAQPVMAGGPVGGNQGGDLVLTLAIRGRGDGHNLEHRDDGTANAILTPNGGRAGIGVGAIAVFDPNQVTSKTNASNPTPELSHTLPGTPNSPVAFPLLEVGKRTGASTDDVRAGIGIGAEADPMFTLQSGAQHGVGTQSAVRRLTPTECERLQGFPDGYTDVPFRGKPPSDGPRYKALGNSMAVPCMAWIGRRIALVEAIP